MRIKLNAKTNKDVEKLTTVENEKFRFSRFQDAYGWRALVQNKKWDEWDEDFYILAGPFKTKFRATDQIKTWMCDESLTF